MNEEETKYKDADGYDYHRNGKPENGIMRFKCVNRKRCSGSCKIVDGKFILGKAHQCREEDPAEQELCEARKEIARMALDADMGFARIYELVTARFPNAAPKLKRRSEQIRVATIRRRLEAQQPVPPAIEDEPAPAIKDEPAPAPSTKKEEQ